MKNGFRIFCIILMFSSLYASAESLTISYYGVTTSGVSVTIDPPGTTTGYPATVNYASPTSVTIKANNYTDAGGAIWVFTGWQGDLTGSTNPVTITVSGTMSITASYLHGDPTPPPSPTPDPVTSPPPPQYYLSVQLNGGTNSLLTVTYDPPGTTNTYPILQPYSSPTSVTVTANNYLREDGSGYAFVKWEGAFVGSTNPVTINVDGQKLLTAFYAVSDPLPPTPTAVPVPTPDPCMFIMGDANGNGTIDIIDALIVVQYYIGLNPASIRTCSSDVDRNGTIDVVDALRIAQCYVGLISCNF